MFRCDSGWLRFKTSKKAEDICQESSMFLVKDASLCLVFLVLGAIPVVPIPNGIENSQSPIFTERKIVISYKIILAVSAHYRQIGEWPVRATSRRIIHFCERLLTRKQPILFP